MSQTPPQNEIDRPPIKVDAVGKVESYGIEYIPDEDRHSRPRNLLWILFGGSMTFGIIVIGWVPVSLGLGWWASASAIVVGSAIGATLMAPMGLLGLRSGSNNPVASGAHFGALGRLIGSALGITADIVFAALCIWAAGEVLARSVVRIFGIESQTTTIVLLISAYALVAIVMTIIAVLGHANMVTFTKWMVPTAGSIMILYVFVAAPNFDPNYSGGDYALGSFWPTWILGMLACAGTINSYGPYVGDWTRHISTKKFEPRQSVSAAWLGGFFGMGGAFMFGAYTAVTFKDPINAYATEFANNVPYWFLFFALYLAFIPGTAQAVINIYNMGLDFSSIVPGLSRVRATIYLSIVSTLLVFVGAFYQQLSAIVSSYLAILIVLGAPWSIINLIGYFNNRGYYDADSLQVYNRGQMGGRYWSSIGLNHRAVIAWAAAVAVGMLFVNTGWYTGPGAHMLNGADIGFVVSTLVGGTVYFAFLKWNPEPAYIFSDQGARIASAPPERYGGFMPIQEMDMSKVRWRIG
ncbi:NCS1 family transporter [Mycolicibacterium fortuitum subsp. fortuitum DSM 46621 = ATCC 6841 = JCM 6387]|uniref:NCS1 family transporter n=2 Tax=Mycolicibacterium fortuitum TaxID=1766 RepID=K0VKU8_MYCFO|nr:cytosine permease [Mycolicibacterium fortuitum]AIY49127.2 Cytosine/purine/uracil/thiamine/allantoin permease family protein [Mycobacterium sp. VKM Ac-1817D]CRL80663.1 purine/cytosine permease [Mycolicibacter nonchromogenicus]BDD96367.1 putative purine/cytosine permease [Mycolicibacterium fortuitum subsp. fortuitum]EJZ15568.1 NCS1 family transporter [Mycolicibacterium fortuitum subsp. fortuitum DSM 46621 = ATCC 6841 = JCM 6387]CRL56692.1 purine/cytosine permease [Mycolicibacterium fortuitum 